MSMFSLFLPTAPWATQTVRHGGGAAGRGRAVSDDLADRGSSTHHSGGTINTPVPMAVPKAVWLLMVDLLLSLSSPLIVFLCVCVCVCLYVCVCVCVCVSRSSLERPPRGTWMCWSSRCWSTAAQRRWTPGWVRLSLYPFIPVLLPNRPGRGARDKYCIPHNIQYLLITQISILIPLGTPPDTYGCILLLIHFVPLCFCAGYERKALRRLPTSMLSQICLGVSQTSLQDVERQHDHTKTQTLKAFVPCSLRRWQQNRGFVSLHQQTWGGELGKWLLATAVICSVPPPLPWWLAVHIKLSVITAPAPRASTQCINTAHQHSAPLGSTQMNYFTGPPDIIFNLWGFFSVNSEEFNHQIVCWLCCYFQVWSQSAIYCFLFYKWLFFLYERWFSIWRKRVKNDSTYLFISLKCMKLFKQWSVLIFLSCCLLVWTWYASVARRNIYI